MITLRDASYSALQQYVVTLEDERDKAVQALAEERARMDRVRQLANDMESGYYASQWAEDIRAAIDAGRGADQPAPARGLEG